MSCDIAFKSCDWWHQSIEKQSIFCRRTALELMLELMKSRSISIVLRTYKTTITWPKCILVCQITVTWCRINVECGYLSENGCIKIRTDLTGFKETHIQNIYGMERLFVTHVRNRAYSRFHKGSNIYRHIAFTSRETFENCIQVMCHYIYVMWLMASIEDKTLVFLQKNQLRIGYLKLRSHANSNGSLGRRHVPPILCSRYLIRSTSIVLPTKISHECILMRLINITSKPMLNVATFFKRAVMERRTSKLKKSNCDSNWNFHPRSPGWILNKFVTSFYGFKNSIDQAVSWNESYTPYGNDHI